MGSWWMYTPHFLTSSAARAQKSLYFQGDSMCSRVVKSRTVTLRVTPVIPCSEGLPQASPAIMGYQTAALQASPASRAGGCLI